MGVTLFVVNVALLTAASHKELRKVDQLFDKKVEWPEGQHHQNRRDEYGTRMDINRIRITPACGMLEAGD